MKQLIINVCSDELSKKKATTYPPQQTMFYSYIVLFLRLQCSYYCWRSYCVYLLIYLILTLLKCLAYTLYIINKKIKVEMEMKRNLCKTTCGAIQCFNRETFNWGQRPGPTTQNLNRMTIHCGNKMKNGQIYLKISLSEERILNS